MAANGTMEVRDAKTSQAPGPRARRRFASMDTVPATAVIASAAKNSREATSPLPIRCRPDQSATPIRNGCRVMRTMPCGARSTKPSWATAVGFGVVRPITTSRNAGSISAIMTGFHHWSCPQVGT